MKMGLGIGGLANETLFETAKFENSNPNQKEEDAPLVQYVDKILTEAYQLGVSDIHFETFETLLRIRFRRDGILHEHATPPYSIAPRLIARLKMLAKLDISERRLPQDGRFKMKMNGQLEIDCRLSTCPTLFGEKAVVRILDSFERLNRLENSGLEDFQKMLFVNSIQKPQGLVLVTGPTGSGKTVSLYTALTILNNNQKNILTCEDPVEIYLPGINQVNINRKAGLTFGMLLRTFLRQDPDVIMVGEIRDVETAEIAIKAAQTGHLVLSTLHTNSAAETIIRLMNMGVPNYNLATSLTLIVAQRLARKLCVFCKTKINLPTAILKEIGFDIHKDEDLCIYDAKGCEHCKEGYNGRIGIYEILPITPAIANIIMKNGNVMDILKQGMLEGFWDLKQSGLHKVKAGITTLTEINRILK